MWRYENDFIGETGNGLFKITPNPSSGVFDLEFSDLKKDVWLHILDSKGKLITKKMLLANQNKIIIEKLTAKKFKDFGDVVETHGYRSL